MFCQSLVRFYWIVGSSPTMTNMDVRFQPNLESNIMAMSFPEGRRPKAEGWKYFTKWMYILRSKCTESIKNIAKDNYRITCIPMIFLVPSLCWKVTTKKGAVIAPLVFWDTAGVEGFNLSPARTPFVSKLQYPFAVLLALHRHAAYYVFYHYTEKTR